jgi:hypothetical protein
VFFSAAMKSNQKGNLMNLLLIVAIILLGLQAFGVNAPRVSLGWLGLALWALSLLVDVTV